MLNQKIRNDLIFRKVQGILDNITPENFKMLSDDLLGTEINSSVILKGFVVLIFNKALDEPKYSSMYAQLCRRLSNEAPIFGPVDRPVIFRRLLLHKCQTKFENRSHASEEFELVQHGPISDEDENWSHLAKRKMLGNIKFIGELAKKKLLSESILHKCIQQLLVDKMRRGNTGQDMSDDLQCLCQMLHTCGHILDTDKGQKLMGQYFARIKLLSDNIDLPPLIRLMLKDVIELRSDDWLPCKATTVDGLISIYQARSPNEHPRNNSYMMRERRNHQDRDLDRLSSHEILRYRMKMRSSFEYRMLADSSIGSSSTNAVHQYSSGYNMYNKQRREFNQNQHSNNSAQYNNVIWGCTHTAFKMERYRQTGSRNRVSRRDSVPPSTLRHQDMLNQKNRNYLTYRKVRGILNKLTPENFKKLSDDLLGTEINSSVILKGFVVLIFNKALDEPKYSSMYAQLCRRLCNEAPNFGPVDRPVTFRRLLLYKCQYKFENRSQASEEFELVQHGPISDEDEKWSQLAKRKMLGNIKFIGELAKMKILSESILHKCIQQLLVDKMRRGDTEQDMSDDLQCLCQMLHTCGHILDTDKGQKLMGQYFARMKLLSDNIDLPPLIRLMLKDVIELRSDDWLPCKATTVDGLISIYQVRSPNEHPRNNSYMMRERRNHQDRDLDRLSSHEILRYRMKMRSSFEYRMLAGSSIGSSSTNAVHQYSSGYNMYNKQRREFNQNEHSNNSAQYNNGLFDFSSDSCNVWSAIVVVVLLCVIIGMYIY